MRLRPDIVVERSADGNPVSLRDPVLGRRIELGRIGREIVNVLDHDGSPDIAAILGEPRTLEATWRTLLLLDLIAGSGTDTVERIRAVLEGRKKLELLSLDGGRFSCQACGECCREYCLGPLTDLDLQRIRQFDPDASFPALAGEPWHAEGRDENGRIIRFLRSTSEHCVFQLPDRRCAIHASGRPDAKPGFCRAYPFAQVATYEGIRVHDMGTCGCFATSERNGEPVSDRLAEVASAMAPPAELFHPILGLNDGVLCDFGYLTRLLPFLLRLASREKTGLAISIRAVGRAVAGFERVVASCPLTTGEPERTITTMLDRFEANPGQFDAEGDCNPRAAAAVIAAVARDLLAVASGLVASTRERTANGLSARLSREAAEVLHLTEVRFRCIADPPGTPLPDYYRSIFDLPLANPEELESILRLSFRQRIFGLDLLVSNRLRPGLLFLGIVPILAITGARLAASRRGAAAVEAGDLSFGHMLAMRLLCQSGPREVLVRRGDDAPVLLEALPLLFG